MKTSSFITSHNKSTIEWMLLRPASCLLLWIPVFIFSRSNAVFLKTYQEVDRLDDVQENLVFPVLDAFWPPGDGVGYGRGGPRSSRVQFVTFLRDVSVHGHATINTHGKHNFPAVIPDWHLLVGDGKVWMKNVHMDSLLKNLAVSSLRVTEVHEFIQQLVDNDKVISDTLLLQFLKVFWEHLKHNTNSSSWEKCWQASVTKMWNRFLLRFGFVD